MLLICFLQVDVTPNGGGHTPVGNWDSLEHLVQATNILVYFIGRIRDKFPTWDANQHLKGFIGTNHVLTVFVLLLSHM